MGGVSASAAIKTRSRKIPYLVVFIKNSHSGTQQKCCTSVCTHASSENKTCSPQIIYLPISLTLPRARRADRTSEESVTSQKANTVQLQKFK